MFCPAKQSVAFMEETLNALVLEATDHSRNVARDATPAIHETILINLFLQYKIKVSIYWGVQWVDQHGS